MKKHRRIAFVGLFLVVLAVAAWFTVRPREPVYQGKALSAWTGEFATIGHNRIRANIAESVAAVQHIGTNGLPFLVKDLRAKDLPWEPVVSWINYRLLLNPGLTPGWARRSSALEAFGALGTAAEPAIPQLEELMKGADKETASWAQAALAAMGSEKVVPVLLWGVTNSDASLQRGAATSLGELHSLAAPAVPYLLAQLDSSDPVLRTRAARALGKIACVPQRVVPALLRRVSDTDPHVRRAVAAALGQFGTEAVEATPALQTVADQGPSRANDVVKRAMIRVQCERREGAIIRGPKQQKAIALVFTGHEYAEGGRAVLDELARRKAKASFFLTGAFLANTNFHHLVERLIEGGHYLGPHSDQHLLYCSWGADRKLLVTREQFRRDLEANLDRLMAAGVQPHELEYFLPPFEHYNRRIADWTEETSVSLTLINSTPGTRSNADYTGEADGNFVSSQAIFDSIVQKEREDPHGLNGFILLLHLGSGPGRKDKFHHRFGELLDYLGGKGYQFVRVDKLLEPKLEENP